MQDNHLNTVIKSTIAQKRAIVSKINQINTDIELVKIFLNDIFTNLGRNTETFINTLEKYKELKQIRKDLVKDSKHIKEVHKSLHTRSCIKGELKSLNYIGDLDSISLDNEDVYQEIYRTRTIYPNLLDNSTKKVYLVKENKVWVDCTHFHKSNFLPLNEIKLK